MENILGFCAICQKPIYEGESFVSFKVPGKNEYFLFHYQPDDNGGGRDCWSRFILFLTLDGQ